MTLAQSSGGAETSHRDLRDEFVLDLAETAQPVHRSHIARRNGIDVHSIGRQFQGQARVNCIMPALATA